MICLFIYRLQRGAFFPKQGFSSFPAVGIQEIQEQKLPCSLLLPYIPCRCRWGCIHEATTAHPSLFHPTPYPGTAFPVAFVLLMQSFCWAIAELTGFYSTVSISSRNFLPRSCSVVMGQRCHQTDLAFHLWQLSEEAVACPEHLCLGLRKC